MHEYSIAIGLLETALRHGEGRRVTAVCVRVGGLRQVVPSTLEFAFEMSARGTVCEGARLEQELVPVRLLCPACAAEWGPPVPDFRCGPCGGPGVVVARNELLMEEIEVEEEPACTG